MTVWLIEQYILWGIWYVMLAVKVWALADSAWRQNTLYAAADKQSKVFWMIVLAVVLVVHVFLQPPGFSILNIIGDVAALVYLADVRPTLQSMRQP